MGKASFVLSVISLSLTALLAVVALLCLTHKADYIDSDR